ncbi:MAG: hypothetical protein COB24_00415 [Hyphomicrobiales bacterium]|nr:MAG: hypothetical protein COB24_00415 [Hyphomicrobiales bacterium]
MLMSKQKLILDKLERQLNKIITLLGKTEPQADLAFCEKQAKTLTVIIKALENIRAMQVPQDDKPSQQSEPETIYETDQQFRDEITQKLAAINQTAD